MSEHFEVRAHGRVSTAANDARRGRIARVTLLRAIASELVRLRRSPLVPLHAVLALGLGVAAGWYFGTTSWDARLACDAFVQLLGAAAPLLVGLACGLGIDAEREAGECANLLGAPSRVRTFAAKALVLLALGLAAAVVAVGVFALVMTAYGRQIVEFAALAASVAGVGAGCALLYLLGLLIALAWGRNAAIAVGAASLVIALMSIGGLANGLVTGTLSGGMTSGLPWLPILWPIRLASLPVELAICATDAVAGGAAAAPALAASLTQAGLMCAVLTALLTPLVLAAVSRFEDRRRLVE